MQCLKPFLGDEGAAVLGEEGVLFVSVKELKHLQLGRRHPHERQFIGGGSDEVCADEIGIGSEHLVAFRIIDLEGVVLEAGKFGKMDDAWPSYN